MIYVNWDALYKLWMEFEGLRLKAYPDPATGNEPWTIGYGHTGGLSGVKVKRGDVITPEQAHQFMVDDLKAALVRVQPLIKVDLNPNQWAALLSFAGNLKWKTFVESSVIKFINEGKLDSVPGRMALYRLGDGKVMSGLVRRRTAEGALWMTPVNIVQSPTDTGSNVSAEPATPKKPFDWGATGAFITLLAGISDQAKKLIGNITSAVGVEPWVLLVVLGAGFVGWTFYSKWKDK